MCGSVCARAPCSFGPGPGGGSWAGRRGHWVGSMLVQIETLLLTTLKSKSTCAQTQSLKNITFLIKQILQVFY